MKQKICINLCDILHFVCEQGKLTENFLNETLEYSLTEKNCAVPDKSWDRIYLGSYFCGAYFIHLPDQELREVVSVCRDKNKKITLVVPIFSQKHLAKGKQQLDYLINEYADVIDEITVNDYGMLGTISRAYDINMNLGRLFMKDYRDPRYADYFMQTLHPKIIAPFFMDMLRNHKITGLEFDKTHAKVDLSAVPRGLNIGVHEPYCYMTVGQICEYASINLPTEKKFRPNEDCRMQCNENWISYNIDKNHDWLQVGRAVYYENKEGEIEGTTAYRRIYFPFSREGIGLLQ